MSRLAVDTTATTNYDLKHDIRSPIYSDDTLSVGPHTPSPPIPSIRLLFSHLSARHVFSLLLPAIFSSIVAGGVAPFMTHVVGQAFATFSAFPQTNPTPHDAADLLHGVGVAALQLVALALAAFALSSLTSCLWIWAGEQNLMALRQWVYDAVSQKDMAWFDAKAGSESPEQGPIGAAGLMTKFTTETDDVRIATSLAAGQLVQYLTTCLACLFIAFTHSWSLTLLILSSVPFLIIIQAISQVLAAPLLASERSTTATAATIIDRVITFISTVKAFNAEAYELSKMSHSFDELSRTTRCLQAVWGATAAFAQFTTLAMFVQGFWFGAKLVREGKISPGDVMTVFWACLIATSNLQMCIPPFIALSKGKFAIVALLTLAGDDSVDPPPYSESPPKTSFSRDRKLSSDICPTFHKIRPAACMGQISLHDITFTHATRSAPALSNVSLYLPARETTFIVGPSGSGKSTIAHLILRMYAPESGQVCLDDCDVRCLDGSWLHSSIVGVGQGWGVDVVVEGRTVRENVALGVGGLLDEDVEEACRGAMLDEFVRGLPDGYDTILGGTGIALSGGQRQRLAIARAWVRDPAVLVLDEATSALDATSRVLVFEALRARRRHKTTIVITHDLSQISPKDFVYVLREGRLAEQGFRSDLENDCGLSSDGGRGLFRKMLDIQTGIHTSVEGNHEGLQTPLRPLVDIAADLTSVTTPGIEDTPHECRRLSNMDVDFPVPPLPVVERGWRERRSSFQVSPTSPAFPSHSSTSSDVTMRELRSNKMDYNDDDEEQDEKDGMNRMEMPANSCRGPRNESSLDIRVDQYQDDVAEFQRTPSFWNTIRASYPSIPHKPVLFLGLVVCVLSGAMTPLFSFLLSRLLFEVSTGAHNITLMNRSGSIVLGVAALDGLLLGLKYFIMESCGMSWITPLRKRALGLILRQDKAWFDKHNHSPVRLVQVLIKDGDDARTLVAVVMGQCLVVVSMLGVGLVWALARGWQMTLVGFAIAPVFGGVMALQTRLVARCEERSKRAREDVGRGFYAAIVNVRAMKAMNGLEGVFREEFKAANEEAINTGVKGAVVEGCTYGVASGLIYLSEALLFYVGAVLIARGTYSYLQMVEVLNLVVFTVTIGSQLMVFTQRIAKSVQATNDINELIKLHHDTPSEALGTFRPSIAGPISLDHVTFSYPERKNVPILKDVSLTINPGECVALVGPSGSGKSTIAALLQRLYEPDSGSISIGSTDLADIDVHHLRHHLSVVAQHPNLFDASISENIRYGSEANEVSEVDVRRAAKQANIHEFTMGLEKGYDTPVGENGALISGGQAQRLQIARALAREADVLISDECTSALDPENQKMVLEAIGGVVRSRDGGEGDDSDGDA